MQKKAGQIPGQPFKIFVQKNYSSAGFIKL